MNKILLMGRMTNDIVIKKGKETEYALFSLAVQRKENKDITDFIDCVVFGKLAKTLETYVGKGNRIMVIGTLHLDKYTDKDGKDKISTKVIVNDFNFIDFKEKKENEDVSEDDLPF